MTPRSSNLAPANCDSGHRVTMQAMPLWPVIVASFLALTTSAEPVHVIGVWDDKVASSLTELFPVVGRGNESLKFRTEYVPNITGTTLSDYLEAYEFIRWKHIYALMGSYNPVIATVATRARKPYFVTSPGLRHISGSPYVMELYPNVDIFTDAVVDLVAYYEMTEIGLIYDCDEGAVIMERLLLDTNLHVMAHRLPKNITQIIMDRETPLSPSYEKTPVRNALKKMRDRYIRSFVVICTSNNTDFVLQQGLSLSIFSSPHNWLLVNMGQEDFDLKRFLDSRVNMTVLQVTMDAKAEDCALPKSSLGLQASLLHDALLLYTELYQTSTINRRRAFKQAMKKTIRKVSMEGCTGKLEFTAHGVREENFLQLKTLEGYTDNTDLEGRRSIGPKYLGQRRDKLLHFLCNERTGTWRSQPESLSLRVEPSLTYSRVRKLADDIFPRRPVQITTKYEPPFVQERKEEPGVVYTGNDRFEGFCIDILNEIAALLNFDYNITLVPDGKFGSLKPYGWTGMIKELLEGRADIALAPFQITPERSSAVDFTKPYMTKGTTVVVKRPEMRMWIFQFLSPLSKVVWIAILMAVLVVSLVLFAVSTANTGRTKQDIETLPGSFWYIWGTLLQGGLSGSPESISARILASAWWFFSLIIISIYTANLAAFLTITVSNIGIDSAADLANQDIYDYGTVEGSQMESFFNFTRMSHYAKMWAHMSTFSRNSMVRRVEDGFERVRKGGYAFIWDSPIVYHEMAVNCDLMEIGSPFDLKGYGFAITKRAPFAEKLSWAILKLNDDGILYRLEGKWWRRNSCPDMRNNATTQSLELENVAGMFLVLLAGILLSLVLCLLQYCINQIRGRKKTKKMKAADKDRQTREENHITSGDDDEIQSCHDSPIFLRPQFNSDPVS